MHFAVGLGFGIVFWGILERYLRLSAKLINPLCFLIMLIWGASGLFFFRQLDVPFLSHTFFYMAVPDWDIPLYRALRWPLLLHRSWLFHSVLIPMGGLGVWLWLSRQSQLTQRQPTLIALMRDCAMGLSVGMCAHLTWDALLSTFRRGFYIHGFSASVSYLWLVINVLLGLSVPWLIAKAMADTGGNRRI